MRSCPIAWSRALLVLHISSGQFTQQIRTTGEDVVLGSDPTADITLQYVGLAPRAARLQREGTGLRVIDLTSERSLQLEVGDEIELGDIGLRLAAVEDASAAPDLPIFGGYEHDPTLPSVRSFELATPEPSPAPPPDVTQRATPPMAGKTTPAEPAKASATPKTRATSTQSNAGRKAPPGKLRVAPVTDAKALLAAVAAEEAARLKAPRFPEPDFGQELLLQLKRSPFFLGSLAAHLLIIFILSLFHTSPFPPGLHDGADTVSASMGDSDDPSKDLESSRDDEELLTPTLDETDIQELLEDDEQPPQPPPEATSLHEKLPDVDDPRQDSVDIGLLPSLTAASNRTRQKAPTLPKVDFHKDFTKGAAKGMNKHAAEVARSMVRRGSGSGRGRARLEDLGPADILVVDGAFDHIENVLDALRLPYVKKAPWSLTSPKPETFKSFKLVFWNCGESLPKKRLGSVARRLQNYVHGGGYLFTTDWGVANVLGVAFPGYLASRGSKAQLPEMTISIRPARSAKDHPLLEGVFPSEVQGRWWLEQSSFDLSVGRKGKSKVTVLIESQELETVFNRSPAVAATFHHGRGRVLHLMGHYYQEAGNMAGTIAAHRLALNFVLMRLDQEREKNSR